MRLLLWGFIFDSKRARNTFVMWGRRKDSGPYKRYPFREVVAAVLGSATYRLSLSHKN